MQFGRLNRLLYFSTLIILPFAYNALLYILYEIINNHDITFTSVYLPSDFDLKTLVILNIPLGVFVDLLYVYQIVILKHWVQVRITIIQHVAIYVLHILVYVAVMFSTLIDLWNIANHSLLVILCLFCIYYSLKKKEQENDIEQK